MYYISKQETSNNTIFVNSTAVIFIRIFFVLVATMVIYAGFYFEANTNESALNIAPENDKNKKGAIDE